MPTKCKLPKDFHNYDYLKLSKETKCQKSSTRLLAMHNIKENNKSLKEISEIFAVGYKTVQGWLKRFRLKGIEGLYEPHRSGAPQKINKEAQKWLCDYIDDMSARTTGGVITIPEVHKELVNKFDISCTVETVYATLHRLGYSWKTSRSIHPKADLKAQEEYKKNLKH